MAIWDYPITTPYGQVPGYPLNNGFHNGIDYGAPIGTDVTVNGVVIGKSGNTGYSSGPHCHVGHWQGGTILDPGVQGGKVVNGATVTECKEDATNGKYVRVADADGSSWVYLHLSVNNLVAPGTKLEGENMSQAEAEKVVTYLYRLGTGDYPNPGQADYWVPRVRDVPTGVDELGTEMLKAQKPADYTPYDGEQLFKKK